MKKLIFTLLVLQIGINILNAQWVQQYQTVLYSHLSDVKFVDRYTGWVSGNQGIVMKTTNGGQNWIEQNTGVTNKILKSICAVNSNVVYIAGYFETILKSTNSGTNWETIKNGPYGEGHSYEGVYFINENTGWICGSGSLIFKTTNGGVSFDSVNIPVGYLYDIYFRNANEGLVCGEAASMYKTTNGGLNWQEIPMVPNGLPLSNFYRMTFFNSNTGYTQGIYTNKVFKTTNFGSSWDSIASVQGAGDTYTICFPNEMTGWCAGSDGLIFKTTNGGYNWQQEIVPPISTSYLHGLWFYNDSVGWAIGANMKILHTTNGGSTYISNESKFISDFKLNQNYPNPFNPTTTIEFSLPKDSYINLQIFDITGKLVINVIKGLMLSKGTHRYRIDGFDKQNLSSGTYFYRLEGIDNQNNKMFVKTNKMVYMK
ncbi:MAG: YCF48-related protein [Ignavibacteriae bacterium]|nr:YCF48-related protein [Ignavibacteriota bacterium]